MAAGRPSATRQSASNPCYPRVIPTITERLTASPLHWMYIITHEYQPRKDTHTHTQKKDT